MIQFQPPALKCTDLTAAFGLRLPSAGGGWSEKTGRQPQAWSLPNPVLRPADLPSPPRPVYQPPCCRDATTQSHSVSRRNVLEGEDLLGQLWPPAIYGFGVCSEQWPAGWGVG